MLYRIATEDVNRDATRALVARYFDSFTVLHGTGVWLGTSEPSTIFEIVTDDRKRVYAAANSIMITNHQTNVLVEEVPEESHMIGQAPQSLPIQALMGDMPSHK